MKNCFYLAVSLLVFSSCANVQKMIDRGEYDQAIDKLVSKMAGKDKKKHEDVLALEFAFKKAQDRDLNKEKALREENLAENWSAIYSLHNKISSRQSKVEALVPLYSSSGYQASFHFINVEELKRESKKNTADFYYQSALRLLDEARSSAEKQSAREAYDYLNRIDPLFSQYKDKDQLKKVAIQLGQKHYLIRLSNESRMVLPEDVEQRMLQFSLDHLNKNWKSFDMHKDPSVDYDYHILVRILDLEFSPEREQSRVYDDVNEETREEVLKDSKGKPVKDSLGNPIKQKIVTKFISTIEEITQRKSVQLGGILEYRNMKNGDVEYSEPLAIEGLFENKTARLLKGDADHVSDECRRKLKGRTMAFPKNEDLLLDASEKLKVRVKAIINKREE